MGNYYSGHLKKWDVVNDYLLKKANARGVGQYGHLLTVVALWMFLIFTDEEW